MDEGAPLERAATPEQLRRLNAAARAAGLRHVDDAVLADLPDGHPSFGGAVRGGEGGDPERPLLVTWTLPRAELSEPLGHVLMEVRAEEYLALPKWDEVEAPEPEGGSGCAWVVALALVLAGAAYGIGAWLDAFAPVGLGLVGLGVVVAVVAIAIMLWDSRRTDYWDAMDEFFGQLELWFALGAAAALAAAGALVLLVDRL